jgi:hypothetical protein
MGFTLERSLAQPCAFALEDFWAREERLFHEKTLAMLINYPEIYGPGPFRSGVLSNTGDRQLAFLESLGFRFGQNPYVPPLAHLMKRLDQKIDALIANGKKPENLFVPRWSFLDRSGHLVHLRFRAPIPEGLEPLTRLMTFSEYYETLVQGIQTMGLVESSANIQPQSHVLLHDITHLGAMMDHVDEYATPLRQALRALQTKIVDSDDVTQGNRLNDRLSFVTEMLILPDPEKRDALKTLLQLPDRPPEHIFTYDEVFDHFSKATDFNLFVSLQNLGESLTAMMIPFGGSAREPAINYGTSFKASMVGNLYRLISKSAYPDGAFQGRSALQDYATLITLLANLQHISPQEFMHEALQISVPKTSMIYKIFCESGVLSSPAARLNYQIFCESY